MATSFKECRRENAEAGNVFGNPDHFGIWYLYTPVGQSVAQRVCGARVEEQPEGTADQTTEIHVQTLWLRCCKDPTCARGGIALPGIGDVIVPEDSPSEVPYAFQDRIRYETEHDWELLFARNRTQRHGPRAT